MITKLVNNKANIIDEFKYFFNIWKPKPRKILFDHLPKCGGSSLNAYLEKQYLNRKIYSINSKNIRGSLDNFISLSVDTRNKYDLVKGHSAHKLINYVHPESIKVTVLRDPIDRTISLFFYIKRRSSHYLHSKISELNLDEFAESEWNVKFRNWYTAHFSGIDVSVAEQNPEKSITRAVEVLLSRYHIIGFLDDFTSFTERLREEAKFRRPYDNEFRNVTTNRPTIADIPKSTIKNIEEINQLDMDFYRRIKKL